MSAHKWFKGPKVNVQHMMLGREENIIDGKEVSDRSSGGSHDGVPGEMPAGKSGGDMKPDGL